MSKDSDSLEKKKSKKKIIKDEESLKDFKTGD